MRVSPRCVLLTASWLGLAVAPAQAQDQRRWVDPPAQGAVPAAPPAAAAPLPAAPPAPSVPAPQGAQPDGAPRAGPPMRSADPARESVPAPRPDTAEAQRLRQEAASQAFAQEYLAFWSAPNSVALEAQREFYGSSVNFHGQERSARSVLEEKRRFARRWPERQYTPRAGTMEAACDLGSDLCTVRLGFDFRAVDPARGRRSEGSGTLELVISFAGREPVIISENSFVTRRGQERTVSLEELND